MKQNGKFSGKLAKKFIFWFLLALFMPLFSYLLFGFLSAKVRKVALLQAVSETHFTVALAAENFFRDHFIPAYRKTALRVISEFDYRKKENYAENINGLNQEWFEDALYEFIEGFWQELGIKKSPQLSRRETLSLEKDLPFALKAILLSFRPETEDFFDVLAAAAIDGAKEQVQIIRELAAIRAKLRRELSVNSTGSGLSWADISALNKLFKPLLAWQDYLLQAEKKVDSGLKPSEAEIKLLRKKYAETLIWRQETLQMLFSLRERFLQGENKKLLLMESADFQKRLQDYFVTDPWTELRSNKRLEGLLNEDNRLINDWEKLFYLTDIFRFPSYELKEKWPQKPGPGEKAVRIIDAYDVAVLLNYDDDNDYTQSQFVGGLVFSISKDTAFWGMALRSEESAELRHILNVGEIRELRRSFHSARLGKQQLEVMSELWPPDFSPEYYYAGLQAPPEMFMLIMLRTDILRDMFEFFYGKNINFGESMPFSQIFPSFQSENGIEEPVFDLSCAGKEIKAAYQNLNKVDFSSIFTAKREQPVSRMEMFKYFLGLREGHPGAFLRNHLWLSETKRFLLDRKQLLVDLDNGNIVIETPGREKIIITPEKNRKSEIFDWLQRKSDSPLFGFRFTRDGERYSGSFIPSESLNAVFFLSLAENTAFGGMNNFLLLLGVGLIIIFASSWVLGRQLYAKTVVPVIALTGIIDRLSILLEYFISGGGIERKKIRENLSSLQLDSRRADEIGVLFRRFGEISLNMTDRLAENMVSAAINEGLLQGEETNKLIKSAAEKLLSATQSEFVLLTFYEGGSKEKLKIFNYASVSENEQSSDFFAEEEQRLLCGFFLRRLAEDQNFSPPTNLAAFLPSQLKVFVIDMEKDSIAAEAIVGIGYLLLGSSTPDWIEEKTRLFLENFCVQMRSVVEKSCLDQLEKEAGLGRSVQLGLLPQKAPGSEGRLDIGFSFVAAKYLGGDFYDFYHLQEPERLGFLISDVSGKGIGASLFGANCKTMLQYFSNVFPEPGAVLSETNIRVCKDKKNALFATVFYGLLDLSSLKFSFASAGHNKMFLYRKTGELQELNAKGLPLGLFEPFSYQTGEKRLDVGDMLVLYTDGVNELESPDKRLYELNRLKIFIRKHRHATADDFCRFLETELEMFRKGVLFDPLFIVALALDKCRFFCHQLSSVFFAAAKEEELNHLLDDSYKYFLETCEDLAADIVLVEEFSYIAGPGFQNFVIQVCDEFLQRFSRTFAKEYLPARELLSDFVLKYVQLRLERAGSQLLKYGLSDLPCGVSASDDITFMVIKVIN